MCYLNLSTKLSKVLLFSFHTMWDIVCKIANLYKSSGHHLCATLPDELRITDETDSKGPVEKVNKYTKCLICIANRHI